MFVNPILGRGQISPKIANASNNVGVVAINILRGAGNDRPHTSRSLTPAIDQRAALNRHSVAARTQLKHPMPQIHEIHGECVGASVEFQLLH